MLKSENWTKGKSMVKAVKGKLCCTCDLRVEFGKSGNNLNKWIMEKFLRNLDKSKYAYFHTNG